MLRTAFALCSLSLVACLSSPTDGLVVLEERGDTRLLAAPSQRGPEQSDVRPARAFVLERDDARRAPTNPVWMATLLENAVAWVHTDGVLSIEDARGTSTIVDRDVIPEIAASPSGARLAYARGPGADAGVFRVVDGRSSRASGDLVSADRPLFVDEDTLIVVGARRGEVAGVFVIEGDAAPRRLTNDGLRVGTPFLKDARFTPPPADHASMRMDGDVLVYSDGVREQRVTIGGTR